MNVGKMCTQSELLIHTNKHTKKGVHKNSLFFQSGKSFLPQSIILSCRYKMHLIYIYVLRCIHS